MLIELRTETKKVRDVRQNAYRVPLKKIKHSLKCFLSLAIRRAGASRHNASAAVLGAARPAGPVVHLAVDRARLRLALLLHLEWWAVRTFVCFTRICSCL